MTQVHVRYDGQSLDLTVEDLGPLSTENEVKTLVAAELNVPANKFNGYAVDRNDAGEITLRPQAVFGG